MNSDNIIQIIDQAKQAYQKEDFSKAIQGYETALQYYKNKNDELNAAEMANNLSVVLLQVKKADLALKFVKDTYLVFEKYNAPIKQAMALGNQAAALEAMKLYDEAIIFYEKSSNLLEVLGESELRAHVLKSLSAVQMRKGKKIESLFSMQNSLSTIEKPSIRQRILNFLLKLPFKFIK